MRPIPPAEKAKTTGFSLKPEIVDRVNEAAERLERSRSWVAAQALKEWLDKNLNT